MNAASNGQGAGNTRAAFKIFLVFLGGTILVFAVTVFGTLGAWELLGVQDRDGGSAMALVFFIAPVVGLLGGILSAIVAATRLGRAATVGPDPSVRTPQDALETALETTRGARTALVVVPAAALGYLIGFVITWVIIGPGATTFVLAQISAWTPILLALLAGAIAYWRVGRAPRAASSSSNLTSEG